MKYIRVLTIFLITLMLFCSCTLNNEETSKQVEYTITQGSNYKDFVQPGNGITEFESFSTESIDYYFEVYKYTEEQRLDFINKVEMLRSYLEKNAEVSFENKLSIYISEDNTLQGIDGKLFLNELYVNSIDSTIAFLQTIFGANSNYGLCYGLANYVNEKLYDDAFISKISIEELGKYYSKSENIILMNLTIPVFQEVYFSKEQNSYAYETAYYFTKDLIERKGFKEIINLLNNSSKLDLSFDTEYTNEKNIWLKSIGATQSCENPIVPLRYELQFGSKLETYPYVINSPSINAYFTIKEGELRREGVIMDYAYIKHYLEMYEQDISALKKYLEPYFDTNKEVIDCYFGEDDKNYYNYSFIKYVTPLKDGVHEYTHYLTSTHYLNALNKYGDPDFRWFVEGIADYCDSYLEKENVYRMKTELFDKNINYSVNRLYNRNFIDVNEKKNESYIKFYQELYAYNQRRSSFDSKFSIASVYSEEFSKIDDYEKEGLDLSYYEASSFVNYLITTYGEDKFFQLYKDYSKLYEIYGKTYEELLKEWDSKFINSYKLEYLIGPEDLKITFFDNSEIYMDSTRSFIDVLGNQTYEYVYCGSGFNKDNELTPDLNEFEGLDLKGKIALIKQDSLYSFVNFFKQVNNAANAGAIGVIVYSDDPISIYNTKYLEGTIADIPTICITTEDGEYLKEAKDKRITIDKDFFGIIDNN